MAYSRIGFGAGAGSVAQHGIASASHSSATVSQLNAKISDGDIPQTIQDLTNVPALGAVGTVLAVAAGGTDTEWVAAGAAGPADELDANGTTLTVDAITDGQMLVRSGTSVTSAAIPTALPPNGSASGDLGGSYPGPSVAAITTTTGPTSLTIGAITDTQWLKRDGTTIVGVAAPAAVTMPNAYAGSPTVALTPATPVTINASSLGATNDVGLLLATSTDASGGATTQLGADLRLRSRGWTGAASHTADARMYVAVDNAGSSPIRANPKIDISVNGAAYSNVIQFNRQQSSIDHVYIPGGTWCGGSIGAGATYTTGIYTSISNWSSIGLSSTQNSIFTGTSYDDSMAFVNAGKSNTNASSYAFAFATSMSGSTTVPDTPYHSIWCWSKGGAAKVISNATWANGDFMWAGRQNGQWAKLGSVTELLTIAAAATTDSTVQFPAGSIGFGVTARVTVAITCTSVFDIGIAGATTRYGTGVSKAANTTNIGTSLDHYAAATAIRVTPDTTPSDATGRLRVTLYYCQLNAATS